jgi:hypothetical protein
MGGLGFSYKMNNGGLNLPLRTFPAISGDVEVHQAPTADRSAVNMEGQYARAFEARGSWKRKRHETPKVEIIGNIRSLGFATSARHFLF